MSNQKPSSPKGTRDFGPIESNKRNHIINTIKWHFVNYGFSQIETPAMENLSVLMGKYGEEGDKLLFKILNSGDFLQKVTESDFKLGSQQVLKTISEKGLRYDLTVPFARFVVQNRNDLTFPFRRFQIQPVWRADKPQKGRYREFYQCDADIIGTKSVFSEVELTNLIKDVFNSLGYSNYLIKINHRELLFGMARMCGLAGNEIPFCTSLDKLDKIGKQKVEEELLALGALHDKLDKLFTLLEKDLGNKEKIEAIKELLPENDGIGTIETFFSYLGDSVKNISLDLNLARGLNYYTGIIFEVVAQNVKIGSICGGGRYDNLTGVFGLPDVSGIGISFGLDRIYDVLEEKNLFPKNLNIHANVLITHFDEASFIHGIDLLNKLRSEGVSSMLYPDVVKINKQFNYANKIDVPFVIVIGEEEVKNKIYTLKEMRTGQQKLLEYSELIKLLKA
ncbi:MAG: histidine--tRNA ligase [Bacteroidota bacterium]